MDCPTCVQLNRELRSATETYLALHEALNGPRGLEELADARRERDEIMDRIKDHEAREHAES